MPTYSYKCNACDYEFERRQRMTDEPVRKCPVCGQPEVRRVIPARLVLSLKDRVSTLPTIVLANAGTGTGFEHQFGRNNCRTQNGKRNQEYNSPSRWF